MAPPWRWRERSRENKREEWERERRRGERKENKSNPRDNGDRSVGFFSPRTVFYRLSSRAAVRSPRW